MVYGVLQLINFAHGDVFMVGAFVGLLRRAARRHARAARPAGFVGVVSRRARWRSARSLGLPHRALRLPPAAQRAAADRAITAIGVSLLLENAGASSISGADPAVLPAAHPVAEPSSRAAASRSRTSR